MKLINEFVEGDHLVVQLLVNSCAKGVNASGTGYLSLEFRDASATINGKKWEVTTNDENILVAGNVVEVTCDVIKYKENLQLKVLSVKEVNNDEVDVIRFVQQPPIPKEELIKRFNAHVASIQDETCSKILNYMIDKFKDKLFTYPAASSIHHEYASGLLMHTVSMADIGAFLYDKYDCNHDLLLTGILLHDMGKMVELEGPIVYKYSLEGKLLGHISIMCSEIRKAAKELSLENETSLLLEHMILSHHGQMEFGSPVLPLTKEALLLSLIDNLDSKMVITNKALEATLEGEFTTKIYQLDGRSFYKHK